MHAISKGGTRLVDDPEAAAQDASRLAGPHPTAAQSQIQERSKGVCNASFVFCIKVIKVCGKVTLHTLKKLMLKKKMPTIHIMITVADC